MVTALHRKLLRDLVRMRGQALAITLVIACGIATFVMSLSTYASLARMQDTYYASHRFARVFAGLKRAPESLSHRIAAIPGVAQVQTRVVVDVLVDVPGMVEPAIGRLVSIPDTPAPMLNDLHLRQGRRAGPGPRGEVLASEAFAEAHSLRPGDQVTALIQGRQESLRITGIALSPEYIYHIRPGDLFPDDRRQGVFWMPRSRLAAAHDMEGAFNDVALSLSPDASAPEVLRQLDRLLAPYGGLGAHLREDQISHRYVSDELVQLRAMATLPPLIFLGVAAFLLNIALNRLVSTQRSQIAALKAFGYSNREVGTHYLFHALVIAVAGTLLGTVGGAWLGSGLTTMYARFFRFPFLEYRVDPGLLGLALLVGTAAGSLGVLGAVRRAVSLPPAVAMRPEPPAAFRPTLVERFGLERHLPQAARMILRELERRPGRALLSVVGLSMAVAIVVLGSFTKDLADHLTDFLFHHAQRQDVTLGLVEPVSARVRHDLRHLPGVQRVEPFRSAAVRLHSHHRDRRVALLGLSSERDLFRVLGMDGRRVDLPPEGVVLSEKLASVLGLGVGDTVHVEVLEGRRPTREVVVSGLLTDFSGNSAFMAIDALNRLLGEGAVVSGAFLSVEPGSADAFHAAVKRVPAIAAAASQRAALETFEALLSENLLRMRLFNMLFGSVVAFGVVYNTARVLLSERSRELATLRVLGFSRADISRILLGEVGVLTLAALPVGCLAGHAFAALAVAGLQTETQQFPLVVSSATYSFALTITLVATAVSSFAVRRRLDDLDLIGVLKAPD